MRSTSCVPFGSGRPFFAISDDFQQRKRFLAGRTAIEDPVAKRA